MQSPDLPALSDKCAGQETSLVGPPKHPLRDTLRRAHRRTRAYDRQPHERLRRATCEDDPCHLLEGGGSDVRKPLFFGDPD
jgi:hypothetical protein